MPSKPWWMRISDMPSKREQSKAKVWVQYTGYIVNESERAVAIAAVPRPRNPEFWIPKSQLGMFTYRDKDSATIRVGEVIEAFQVALWWAQKNGLVK